jgi:deazaflavin-dependent oxidoreductase (nitroreductase family)
MPVVQKRGRTETVVAAPVDAVWQVVSDVTRTGEWSHECRDARWLDGARAATPGARFRGRNRAGPWAWGRTCEIVAIDEPRELSWRTVPTALFPDSTLWRFRLEPVGSGTRIVQEFEVVRAPAVLDHLYAALIPAHQDRGQRLSADLERLGAAASRNSDTAPAAPSRPPRHRRLTRIGNRIGVWLYRRSNGRLGSGRSGVHVLLLSVPGRRTGVARCACVRFLDLDGGWLVWGTGSGAPSDPDWFENLRAADAATVQIGSVSTPVHPRELVGDERDRTWRGVVLARAPEVARQARKARRQIPVAVLTPL